MAWVPEAVRIIFIYKKKKSKKRFFIWEQNHLHERVLVISITVCSAAIGDA